MANGKTCYFILISVNIDIKVMIRPVGRNAFQFKEKDTYMAAVAAPAVELNVTENAAVEIKKFMSSEDDLPETAGLRVRVVPGGC